VKRTRVASRAGLAVVLIAIACTESIGPERRNPGVPMFSYSANGITLNKQNGTLGGSGQLLIKGFNPTNPHHGDAIIATFFWLGSSNIIDSVRDVLTTAPSYTPVGNRYTLVEYVTAGGYSMATYIATNVQGFPDPNTDPNQSDILAVGAYLSQSVADGGVVLSSWTGVEDNFATALGNHRSASGSGAAGTAMPAQAGPIAINAGLGQGSDNSMKEGGAYAVQTSAGTTDPVWQWFNGSGSTGTWLATNLALNTATAPAANQPPTADFTSSCSALNCSFTSTSSDPDGTIASYSWNFGDGGTSTAQNPSHTYGATGSYSVTLQVTDNQGAQSPITTKTVNVTAPNQAPTANFTFSCSALTCNFTSTSSDPDGTISAYSWNFGDGATSTAQNPSRTYAAGGSYNVTLRVTDNQGAQSPITTKTVNVTAPNQAPTANFSFSCSGLTCNFTSTSSDPDGSIASYSWNFGDGATSTAQNPSRTYAAGGSYSVRLTVTDNRGATNFITKTVTVTAPNSAPVVNAGPDANAFTGLLYSFTWSFSDANHNGPWSYTIDWGDGTTSSGTVSSEGSFSAGHTYVIIFPRSFTIRVTVRDAAGASASDTKVVSVLLL